MCKMKFNSFSKANLLTCTFVDKVVLVNPFVHCLKFCFSLFPSFDILPQTVDLFTVYHENEVGIDKSVLRITVWHHEGCRVITNGDRTRDDSIFL